MHWLPAILILPYFYLIIRVWRSLQKLKPYKPVSYKSIFISIIIPCRNESVHLPFLLNDISLQDYPEDSFEVIVIDDNSTDSTSGIISDYIKIKNLSIIKNEGAGKKAAIRTGINYSKGEIIITTDADCRFKGKWLKTIGSYFIDKKPEMLICPVQLENKSGFFNRFQEIEFLSLQGVTAGCANQENAIMCNGANLSFTKTAYQQHSDNLHDEIASGDDIFFLHSLKKQPGAKIMWLESSDARATAASSTGITEFLSQRKRWISKGSAYKDKPTIIMAIVTFVTILILLSLAILSFFNPLFIQVLVISFLLKAVPDFLILFNTTGRYSRKPLLRWFLQAELMYPFYVLGIWFFNRNVTPNKTSSPFQRGT